MKHELSNQIRTVLACPYCRGPLLRTSKGAKCSLCLQEYTYSNEGQLDLRLRRRKQQQLQFELDPYPLPEECRNFDFEPLQKCISPQVDFSDFKVPHHLSEELISYFPKAISRSDSLMLDLGCGNAVHREVGERAGFEYVGVDYDSPDATILGDAQSLPFGDSSFEFVLSIAVLEHIRYPFVMMSEVYRVLKSGGKFIGTVAFLEPFHENSFYHHTHLGTFNSLQFAGFDIEYIAPSVKWSVLIAPLSVLFPLSPQQLSKLFILPVYLLHRIWWKLGYWITHSSKADDKFRVLVSTGSFAFIANKNGGDSSK